MELKSTMEERAFAVRIAATDDKGEQGRIFLYVLYNNLHAEPFGLIEDLFVSEAARSHGLGRQLIEAAIAEAKKQGCYKLICTSRSGRDELHEWYKKLGFKEWGNEFRMDL